MSASTTVDPSVPSGVSRRDRMRAQTMAEITTAARQLVIAEGPSGIQLRAVARDVGLTAPALYRYYPSLNDLVIALTVELFEELVEALKTARDADPTADVFTRMLNTSRAFRGWAVNNPQEFGLVFATPQASFAHAPDSACDVASGEFGTVFAELFLEIWDQYPFDVDPPDALAPGMVEGLTPYWTWLTETLAPTIPMGAVVVFLEGWIRLYGTVAMEVFGHLSWAVADGAAMFEQSLRSLATSVHRTEAYSPPG